MRRLLFYISSIFLLLIIGCEDDLSNTQNEDIREKLINTWNVVENSVKYKEQSYSARIEKDFLNNNRILIYNFFNLGMQFSVYAIIENKKITIPNQKVNDCELFGTGEISSNYDDIFIEYSADFGDGAEQITAKFTTKPIVKVNNIDPL